MLPTARLVLPGFENAAKVKLNPIHYRGATPAQNDVMVFVAGRNSSNGKVLYHICQEANTRTYFVEMESELDPAWFAGVGTVGISGATSTPQWLMERVKRTIEEMVVPAETV